MFRPLNRPNPEFRWLSDAEVNQIGHGSTAFPGFGDGTSGMAGNDPAQAMAYTNSLAAEKEAMRRGEQRFGGPDQAEAFMQGAAGNADPQIFSSPHGPPNQWVDFQNKMTAQAGDANAAAGADAGADYGAPFRNRGGSWLEAFWSPNDGKTQGIQQSTALGNQYNAYKNQSALLQQLQQLQGGGY